MFQYFSNLLSSNPKWGKKSRHANHTNVLYRFELLLYVPHAPTQHNYDKEVTHFQFKSELFFEVQVNLREKKKTVDACLFFATIFSVVLKWGQNYRHCHSYQCVWKFCYVFFFRTHAPLKIMTRWSHICGSSYNFF